MVQHLLLDETNCGIGKYSILAGFFLLTAIIVLLPRNANAEENSYLHSVTVEQGTHQGSINCFGCSVVVKGDLDGEITTIGGDVTVYGKVRKDVVTVGGAIHLKNGAEVDADVVAIGGGITTEGTMTAPGKDAFASFPWMHLPGQMSIGWRGALALLGFHAVCVLLPILLLRPSRVQNIVLATRRWLVTGLVGMGTVVAISLLLDLLDEELHFGDAAALVVVILFLAVLAAGVAGVTLAVGERFFPRRIAAALCIGGILLIALELIPYLGFLVMILGSFWATGAALWSVLGFRGPQPPASKEAPALLKLTS
jgi:hypothetical protein